MRHPVRTSSSSIFSSVFRSVSNTSSLILHIMTRIKFSGDGYIEFFKFWRYPPVLFIPCSNYLCIESHISRNTLDGWHLILQPVHFLSSLAYNSRMKRCFWIKYKIKYNTQGTRVGSGFRDRTLAIKTAESLPREFLRSGSKAENVKEEERAKDSDYNGQ